MITEQCQMWCETEAECYGQKDDNRFQGRWEMFLASTTHTRIALAASCISLYNCWAAQTASYLLFIRSQADRLFCSRRSLILFEAIIARTSCTKCTWQVTRHKRIAFFRRLYVTSVSLWEGSLCFSMANYTLFLSHGNKNYQLLQYGHAYQLSVRVSVKNDWRTRVRTVKQCENRNINFFIGCYCTRIQGDIKCLPPMLTNHPYIPLDLNVTRDVRHQAPPLFLWVLKISGDLGTRTINCVRAKCNNHMWPNLRKPSIFAYMAQCTF